jgi:two-component system nitrate/nitrite response regulator NarL
MGGDRVEGGAPGGRARDPIEVFIAEHHPLYRFALELTVERHPQLRLVGVAADGQVAREELKRLRPEVALLDLGLPRCDGMVLLASVRSESLPVKALVLSGTVDGSTVRAALAAGARGFLSKDATSDQISEAVIAVARGQVPVSADAGQALAQTLGVESNRGRLRLTTREREVLVLLAEGQSGPQIARALYVSPATVKSHTAALYSKLGVSTRAAAIAEAFREGML